LNNTHCSLRRDRELPVSMGGQVTNSQEPEECCSMSIPFALQITIHVRSSPVGTDSTSRRPSQPPRAPICLRWSYILWSETGEERGLYKCTWRILALIVVQNDIWVCRRKGAVSCTCSWAGRLGLLSRQRGWLVTDGSSSQSSEVRGEKFSHSRGYAFSETPCYRYRKVTRQRHKVDHSTSSRTGLRMSGSKPLLPLHVFIRRRGTTASHNNTVVISCFVVYLIISILQYMCRTIDIWW
jgi:hypothetical protein